MLFDIIVLTKSFKHGSHCIAGINAKNGEWIRLVTDDLSTEGAVPDDDAQYSNGRPVKVLDCVKVDLIRALPTNAQMENWLYNGEVVWQFVKRYSMDEVLNLHPLDTAHPIFGSYDNSCSPNQLDGRSLLLVKVSHPYIQVKTYENEYSYKTKVYFNFFINGINYSRFSVSDRDLYCEYIQKSDGFYPLNDGYAILSLTGAWSPSGRDNDIKHYKMLAQFFYI